tara:strand:+ start:350 stop:1261 length:912 start_codon:yes stop_codon:yes gene_type:complete
MENSPYHIPVLLHVATDALITKENGLYIDLTFGGGGHSKAILKKIKDGQLIAFDQDEDAFRNDIDDERFTLVRQNFKYVQNVLLSRGINKVDGILADLGVSSHQFDTPERGFSYRFDGELDMRMNTSSSTTAFQVVNEYDESNLVRILVSYGEFKRGEARKIFRKIEENRSVKSINTTGDLQEILEPMFPARFLNKNLSKIFQSIRIEVNEEMQALKELLNQLVDCLNPNGIAAFITYHSIEDRMVKNFFKSGNIDGELTKDFYGKILKPFELVNKKPIIPSEIEINQNPRARSAKLRMAKRL